MTIETKYNIGDEVFLLIRNKVERYPIVDIRIDVNYKRTNTGYRLQTQAGHTEYYSEDELFPTKEELLKSL